MQQKGTPAKQAKTSTASANPDPEPKEKKKKAKKTKKVEEKSSRLPPSEEWEKRLREHYAGRPLEEAPSRLSRESLCVRREEESACDWLETQLPKWLEWTVRGKGGGGGRPGSPLLLLLCGSALRCVSLKRDLGRWAGATAGQALLFAKHKKVGEQTAMLKAREVAVAVGTPGRVLELVRSGALSLRRLRAVGVDWHHADQKLRRLIDMTELRAQLFDCLADGVIPNCTRESLKILLL